MKLELPEAEAQEQQALAHLDGWEWLFHEMRQALEPIDLQGHIASARQVRQTVQTALELLATLNNETIQAFTTQLAEKLDELVAPIVWLEQALAPRREGLSRETETFILWTWFPSSPAVQWSCMRERYWQKGPPSRSLPNQIY